MESPEAVQFDYRNPYRRHSSIGIPVNHQFPASEYDERFIPFKTDSQKREYDVNRRREGEWPEGSNDWSTENKENFKENNVTRIVRARAYSNIGLFDDALSNTSETRSAYRAQYGRRSMSNLSSDSSTWSPAHPETQLSPEKPVRASSTGGMFSLTTETSARYGRRQGLTDKPNKYTMRDNLRTPGPEAKFETYSAHREMFRPMPVTKRVNWKSKDNIKTFDDNYLMSLEKDINKIKEKKRSVSMQSLEPQPLEVLGEDEILYKANNYTNR